MVKKLCPQCQNASYSAKTKGEWICPTCGFDLTDYQERPLDYSDQLNDQDSLQLAVGYKEK